LLNRADAGNSHRPAAVTVSIYFLIAVIYAKRNQEERVFDVDFERFQNGFRLLESAFVTGKGKF